MTRPSARQRRDVTVRAGNRCEYCQLSQAGQEAAFHIDHVIPVAAQGATHLNNLALACVSCSLRKGARTHATDPKTATVVRLFNPRTDAWDAHFEWSGHHASGTTPVGRATVHQLRMNRALALEIRQEERLIGRFPPVPSQR